MLCVAYACNYTTNKWIIRKTVCEYSIEHKTSAQTFSFLIIMAVHISLFWQPYRMRPLWVLILGWLFVFVTVIGKSLVIFLITTRRNLRTTTNWFVLSLAVADFGVGTVVWYPISTFCSKRDASCVGEVAKTVAIIGVLCRRASLTNLCAQDHYLAIVHPLRYVTFMTKKRVVRLLSAAWGIAILVAVFRLLSGFVLSGKSQRRVYRQTGSMLSTVFGLCSCIFLLFATVRIFLSRRS